ncbi:MAG TPA: hypothetical protein V6D23_19720, partial [Candidatus Obscuribacterales bacterium]
MMIQPDEQETFKVVGPDDREVLAWTAAERREKLVWRYWKDWNQILELGPQIAERTQAWSVLRAALKPELERLDETDPPDQLGQLSALKSFALHSAEPEQLSPVQAAIALALAPGREALDYLLLSLGPAKALTATLASLYLSKELNHTAFALKWHAQAGCALRLEVPHPAWIAWQEVIAKLSPEARLALAEQARQEAVQPVARMLLALVFQDQAAAEAEVLNWLELCRKLNCGNDLFLARRRQAWSALRAVLEAELKDLNQTDPADLDDLLVHFKSVVSLSADPYNMLYPKELALIMALVPGREGLDHLVLSHGLESALTATYESLNWSKVTDPEPQLCWREQTGPELRPGLHPAWLALQGMIARLAPAQKTALRAQASRWARQPAQQRLLDWLFQARDVSEDELQGWLELSQESAVRSWFAPAGLMLWTQLRDSWLIELLAGMYLEYAQHQGWRERFGVVLEQSLFRLVERAGSAAAAGLGLVVRTGASSVLRAAAAEALSLLHTRRALAVMAGLLDTSEGPRLAGVFKAHPARGVAVLLARAAAAPASSGAALRLIEAIILAHPGLTPEEPPVGKAAALWQTLRQAAPEPALIPDQALPECFWRPQDLLPELPTLELTLLPGAESFATAEGVRPYIYQKPPASSSKDAETLASLKAKQQRGELALWGLDGLSHDAALRFLNSFLQSKDAYSFDPAAQARVEGFYSSSDKDFESILARFGLAALPGLIALSWGQPSAFRSLAQIASSRLGYVMAAGLRLPFASFGTSENDPLLSAPDICRHWLRRHPYEAALGLIPVACGKAGPARELARRALCMLWLEGARAALAQAAAAYGQEVEAALQGFFAKAADADPSELRPGLPGWWDARRLPPPLLEHPLADGAQAFSLAARDQLARQLARCTPFFPSAAIRSLRELCTPESLAGFAWKQFELWLDHGAEACHDWMLYALGHLGDRGCIQGLMARIETWPEQKPRLEMMNRALSGLEALSCLARNDAASGTHALAAIQRLALTCPHQILRDAAQTRLEELAAERGQSLAALEDESVPDYGFIADPVLRLSRIALGGKHWQLGFGAGWRARLEPADPAAEQAGPPP